MPSPLGHVFIGLSLAHAVYQENFLSRKRLGALILVAIGSILPDFDMLLVFIYDDPMLHRRVSHSLFFAALLGISILVFGRITGRASVRAALLASLLVASHVGADILVPPGMLPMPIRPFLPWDSTPMVSSFVLFENITWLKWELLFSWGTVMAVSQELAITATFLLVISRLSGVALYPSPAAIRGSYVSDAPRGDGRGNSE